MELSRETENASRSGLSLYANLLKSAPESDAARQASNPSILKAPDITKPPTSTALQFQPPRKLQNTTVKAKAKNVISRASTSATKIEEELSRTGKSSAIPKVSARSSLAEWTVGNQDDDQDILDLRKEKPQRGGKRNRKKARNDGAPQQQDWNDIYDPSRPNSYEGYKDSDEKYLEIREWKDILYKPRNSEQLTPEETHDCKTTAHSQAQAYMPAPTITSASARGILEDPSLHSSQANASSGLSHDFVESQGVQTERSQDIPQTSIEMNVSADYDDSGHLLNTSGLHVDSPRTQTRIITKGPLNYPAPTPPVISDAGAAAQTQPLHETEQEQVAHQSETADQRSLRPGQHGFAERLMSRYGWRKGSGLGAQESGMKAPLQVKLDKKKRKPDSEGGGFSAPGGMGKIVGEHQREGGGGQQSMFGVMSEVIVLRGMLGGIDVDGESDTIGGGLAQEIGEECADKYGRVERVFIDRHMNAEPTVFIKFTSQLSALRAVNALEGRLFNGNAIIAKFYDADNFESGQYI